ncbi:MAG: biotin--[Bacteroides sp.]|nr:biotin--[acetyl-CoA-carboxylase] ligase [Bacteroides sp.]
MIYPKNINLTIERLKVVPSTNSYLVQLCKESKAKEFYTVIADNQTAGRGQRGNSWESEEGKNLTFSTVLFPTALEAKEQFYLSMTIAFAIVDALDGYTEGFSIKWPNDIYWKDKKIGGILIENELEGKYITQSIVGIGINVNQEVFHSSAPNPVSLAQIVGTSIDRKELFNKILKGIMGGYIFLETAYNQAVPNIRKLYTQKLYRREGLYPYRDAEGTFMAEIEEVEASGHIVLKDEQGALRRYAFKEVEFVLP